MLLPNPGETWRNNAGQPAIVQDSNAGEVINGQLRHYSIHEFIANWTNIVRKLMSKVIVTGEPDAARVASYLIYRSQYFQLTPLSDGEYEFVIKPENEHMLLEYIKLEYIKATK